MTAKYFLSLEHLEDILFCYLDDNGHAVKIETYQSKKKSTGSWKIGDDLTEIIIKILQTGKSLLKESYPKCESYAHDLFFSSNTAMQLQKRIKEAKSGKSKIITHTLNEENKQTLYNDLDPIIREEILSRLEKVKCYSEQKLSDQLGYLNFLYIDFNKTSKEQENQLRGKLENIFERKITDYNAALETIFSLFSDVEATYNQKSVARLSDVTKQVRSDDISNALNVITTESKAYNFWRSHQNEISKKLKIKPFEKDSFELMFISAFDLFKSKDEAEHQKILKFARDRYKECKSYTEDECVEELVEKFNTECSTNLDEKTLTATMYAAYFESINKMDD